MALTDGTQPVVDSASGVDAPPREAVIHPLYVRITHWINALALAIMIGSGWQIYNAAPLFGVHLSRAASRWAAGWPAACSGISPPCGC